MKMISKDYFLDVYKKIEIGVALNIRVYDYYSSSFECCINHIQCIELDDHDILLSYFKSTTLI